MKPVAEHASPRIRGFKHTIHQFFRPEDAARIDETIRYVHAVMCNASLLIKYRLFKIVESGEVGHDTAPMVVDETQVLNAIRAVQEYRAATEGDDPGAARKKKTTTRIRKRPRTETTDEETLDEIEAASTAAAAQKDLRQQTIDSWIADYDEMLSSCGNYPVELRSRGELSASHIFGIAAKQLAAATLSNIRYHFRSYVCASLGLVLRSCVCSLADVKHFSDLPAGEAKRWRREFGKAYDDVLFHRTGKDVKSCEALRATIERHRHRLVPPLPPMTRTIDRDMDSSTRPYIYLGYMLRMTRFQEMCGVKAGRLFTPVPLKTSHIPAHYAMDTSCIAQLLMDAPRIKSFAIYFEKSVRGGFALPGLLRKDTLLRSLQVLSGRSEPVTAGDEELYKDALWAYLANFKNRRTKILNPLLHKKATQQGAMRFAHSISTDGYSVTLVVSDEETRGRKHQYKSAVSARTSKKKVEPKPPEFPALSSESARSVKEELMSMGCGDAAEYLGGDPGKSNLLMLVDAAGKSLRYTSAHRGHNTLARKRSLAMRVARSQRCDTPSTPCDGGKPFQRSAQDLERDMARQGLSSRTSDMWKFRQYIAYREATRVALEAVYHRRLFRAMRFLAWSRRAGSVEKFAKRILEKFGGESRSNAQVVILYGDWGRRPNLKHQAPTPGIGLRRLLHETPGLTTVTVGETYTSSFCPKCGGEVANARGAHGLLKCSSGGCGTWWSRDVVGAKNILAKGLHLLREQTPHPLFGS
ncbi:hypothetical protein TSOC_012071 [Tetrabaena socialis]|uniref:Cas12f1-like TNB domain-containing protein n=1 Tax=Tetrabaena socialis TaxID=47790 RepID=A0A2J7ZNZ7_9CHLO|nr:hypothetical protein TSOC_012071 [Tetrabaena socialis]|eukprot:PNH01995.1 hypothetical protein TSOC_012071 [Tetrabaena socialis]